MKNHVFPLMSLLGRIEGIWWSMKLEIESGSGLPVCWWKLGNLKKDGRGDRLRTILFKIPMPRSSWWLPFTSALVGCWNSLVAIVGKGWKPMGYGYEHVCTPWGSVKQEEQNAACSVSSLGPLRSRRSRELR
jgi:hypothetical protein